MDNRSERDVEVNVVAPLFQKVLGYPETDLAWARPVTIQLGRQRLVKEADLVVSRGSKPLITVEAKRPTESVRGGLDQVDSYAFALKTPYSVITNGRHVILRVYYAYNERVNIIDSSVHDLTKADWAPLRALLSYDRIMDSIKEEPNVSPRPDLESIKDFRRYFKRIHNAIRDNDKLDPSAAFDELSKLLFLKAAEEEARENPATADRPSLTPEKIDEWESLEKGKSVTYVNDWFRSATRELFPGVADDEQKIKLSPNALKTVLSQLAPFHVKGDDVDVKGRAFEEFLPSQLRGKGLGQFFTPRPIVDFMVGLADISIQDVVVDFACGSGGFLIKAFEQMRSGVETIPAGTLSRIGTTRDQLLDDIKQKQLFGVDAEPRAARTAKMNMLMWGDGRRVVRGNSLAPHDHSGKPYEVRDYTAGDPESGCTLILANPPFGSREKDPEILKLYDLGAKRKATKSEKTEVLFVEKGIRLLQPEGRMLIVLPQGLMSGKSYARVRGYILSHAEVRAIISLPTHTFVQSGVPTVNTCILYVQKYTAEKRAMFESRYGKLDLDAVPEAVRGDSDFEHSIFMGTSEYIGYEPNGRSIAQDSEKTDLDLLLEDFRNRDSLSNEPIDLFSFATKHYGDKPHRRRDQVVRGTTKGLKTAFNVNLSETDGRLDPPFYLFRAHAAPILSSVPPLGDTVSEKKGRFSPETPAELDAEYKILGVSSDGLITLTDTVSGEDITQKYKKVCTGDIAYNPMRANIGSFGVVPTELDGGLISPDYFVVRSKALDPEFLISLLRTPFYRMYIDVVSTGSIRDRLYPEDLRTLRVPQAGDEDVVGIKNAIGDAERSFEAASQRLATEKAQVYASVERLVRGSRREGS